MPQRKHTAIMFTDIVGYTALMGKDENRAFEVLQKNKALHKRLIKKYEGELIKEMGDGLLISIPLASDAVRCAQEIQYVAKNENIGLRIGIHEGEVLFEDGDVLGDGVNIASRLQEDTDPGYISISGAVYNNIKNKPEIEAEFVKETTFKNVEELVKVYKIRNITQPIKNIPSDSQDNVWEEVTGIDTVGSAKELDISSPPAKKRLKIIYVFIVVLAVLVIVFVYPKIFKKDKFEGVRDPDDRISIAVMPFKNLTGDTLFNVWQEGIQNLLITSLSNSEELSVRQYETIHNIFKSKGQINYSSITPSIAGDIALKLEAKTVIVGNIFLSGNTVRITANLLNSKSEEIYRSYEINGNTEDDFFTITDSLSLLVKNYLEIKIIKQNLPFDQSNVYTSSSEAYKLYLQGYNCHSRLDYDCAVDFYNRALKIDSNFASAMMRLAYCYGDLRQTEMSKFWAYKASDRIDQLPLDMQLMVKEVKAAVDKEPLEMIKHTKQYLEINPHSMRKHYGIGWAYFNTEQWQEAIEEFEKTLEISSRYEIKTWAWTYILLGRAYHKTGEHKKENKIFEEVPGLFPNEESQIVYWQAVCALSQRDTIGGNEYLDEIKAIGKQEGWPESEVLSWLGSAFDQAGNLFKAEEMYRRAFLINPKDPELANELAYFLISNEINMDEGFELITSVMENKDKNGNYLHTYGLGLFKKGKLKEAQQALKKGWDLIPYYVHDHFTHIQEVEKALASQSN